MIRRMSAGGSPSKWNPSTNPKPLDNMAAKLAEKSSDLKVKKDFFSTIKKQERDTVSGCTHPGVFSVKPAIADSKFCSVTRRRSNERS